MKIQYTALCCLLVLLIAGCAHNPKVPYRGAKLSERYTIAQLDSAVATEEALITSAAALAGREENSQKDVPFFNHPRRYPTRAEWARMKSLAQAGDEIFRFRGESEMIDRYGTTLCLMRENRVIFTTYIPLEMYYIKEAANQRLQGTPESVPSSSTEPEARRP